MQCTHVKRGMIHGQVKQANLAYMYVAVHVIGEAQVYRLGVVCILCACLLAAVVCGFVTHIYVFSCSVS